MGSSPPSPLCRALSASSATADSNNEPLSIELYNNSLADFTTAIHYHSNNHDTYKRRGQVYAALGGEKNNKLAIQGEKDDGSSWCTSTATEELTKHALVFVSVCVSLLVHITPS